MPPLGPRILPLNNLGELKTADVARILTVQVACAVAGENRRASTPWVRQNRNCQDREMGRKGGFQLRHHLV